MNSLAASLKVTSDGGRITSEASMSSSATRLAVVADVLEQRLHRFPEAVFATGLDDRDDPFLEFVDALALAVVEAVLVLAGDADDHGGYSPWPGWSAPPEAIWGAGWAPP